MRHLAIAMLLTATVVAQGLPAFEVVSIKKAAAVEHGGGRSMLYPDGHFSMTNGPTRVLLNWAYPTQTSEIIGAPDWVTYENFDVEARPGREVTRDEFAAMMRTLLGDRFKAQARLETRVRPMYELRVARPGQFGPAMRPATVDCETIRCTIEGGDGVIESIGAQMPAFVTWLPYRVGRPVIDKTGLTGYYALTLKFSTGPDDSAPALLTALREQLGLTLEPVDAPTEVLVIEHIERPSGN